ncbi:MAG: hypothetical protein ABSD02_18190 [Steroidobacteraceae bacterium]|jgi:hypothetical protein
MDKEGWQIIGNSRKRGVRVRSIRLDSIPKRHLKGFTNRANSGEELPDERNIAGIGRVRHKSAKTGRSMTEKGAIDLPLGGSGRL